MREEIRHRLRKIEPSWLLFFSTALRRIHNLYYRSQLLYRRLKCSQVLLHKTDVFVLSVRNLGALERLELDTN